jgi:hypothetical protein
MARSIGTIEKLQPPGSLRHGYPFQPDPVGFFEVHSVDDGMQVDAPRDKVRKGSLEVATNVRVRDGQAKRRPGTTTYQGATENEVVLGLHSFSTEFYSLLVRITTARISVDEGAGSWTNYATGTFGRRFTSAPFVDDLYLANGESAIRRVIFSAGTAAPMADAPAARYITNFADRIVGGNVSGGAGYQIIWPVNGDPTDWTGVGSGEENLVTGVSDLSDDIVGLFGSERVMIILREKSIWTASRLPYADAPFKFEPAFSGFGCDMPYTAVKVTGGIIFANYARKAIYYYAPGGQPIDMTTGFLDRDDLFASLNVNSKDSAQAAWDHDFDEYHLGEPNLDGLNKYTMQRFWVGKPGLNAWVLDDSPDMTAIAWASHAYAPIYIDDLVGTIDSLTGTIDEQVTSIDESKTEALFKALPQKVVYQDESAITDASGTADFIAEIVSPNLGGLRERFTFQDLGSQIKSTAGCTVVIENSVDKSTWRNSQTVTVSGVADLQELLYRRQRITGPNLYWRFKVTGGDFALFSYWVRVLQKGQHR